MCRKTQHESIQLVQDTLCTLRLADRGSPRFGRATQQQSFEKGQVEDVYHWRFMDPNSDFWRSIHVYSEFFCLNFLGLVLFGLQVIAFGGLRGWWWFVSYCHWTRIISSMGSACNAMDCLSTMSPVSKHLWTNRATITWKWMLLLLLSRLGHPSRPSRPYSYTTFKEQGLCKPPKSIKCHSYQLHAPI